MVLIVGQDGPPPEPARPPAEEEESARPPAPIGFEAPPQNSAGEFIVPPLDAGQKFKPLGEGQRNFRPGTIDRGDVRRYEPAYYSTDLDYIIRTTTDPRMIESIQASLVYVGILNKTNDVVYGSWDDKSVAAFEELLAISNRSGSTWNRTLERMLRSSSVVGAQPSGRGGGGGRAPFQAQIPNQEEVKAGFADVRSGMLGGQWARDDDAELSAKKDEFAKDFTVEVVGAQRDAYAGRTVEQAPSLQFSAEERVKRDEEAGVNANLFRGYADAMTRALGNG